MFRKLIAPSVGIALLCSARLKLVPLAVTFAALLGLTDSVVNRADAALITFTDRVLWRAAAGGGVGDLTQDFDTFVGTTNYATTTGVTAGFLHFGTTTGNAFFAGDPTWSIRDSSPLGGSQTLNGSPYVSLVNFAFVVNGTADPFNTLVSHSAISAIGFDYRGPFDNPNGAANPLTLFTSLGDAATGPFIPIDSSGFFGILYDAGETFTSIAVQDLADGRTFFGADNFEAFSPTNTVTSAIPEPTTLALFGIGLTGLAFVRRRRTVVDKTGQRSGRRL